MLFPCIQCGLCCRKVDKISALPEFNRGDGVCRHLINNLCEIYENRPLICNVQRMYDSFFRKSIDEKTFIQENIKACLKLAAGNTELISKLEAILGVRMFK
jgi:Fe-S-cluster containining protein